eukprot:m.216393 g.216393  ORF g.216393 m.216393 type:complete len:98 (+) comp10784_c0_seq3:3956-4249(+)
MSLARVLFVGFMLGVNVFMLNLMINLMDDFMQKINGEEGDAFPFEKARIIAEIELSMTPEQLQDETLFPKWIHIMSPKVWLTRRAPCGNPSGLAEVA